MLQNQSEFKKKQTKKKLQVIRHISVNVLVTLSKVSIYYQVTYYVLDTVGNLNILTCWYKDSVFLPALATERKWKQGL